MAKAPTTQKRHKQEREKLFLALAQGLTREQACAYAGISMNKLRNWVKEAEALAATTDETGFLDELANAEATAALRWLSLIDTAAERDWKAAAWKLERRFPRSYGKAEAAPQLTGKIEHHHHHDHAISITTADEAENAAKILAVMDELGLFAQAKPVLELETSNEQ